MGAPIQSGDQALVIGGLGRHKSPNVGQRVTVGLCMGEHSEHGRIWRCSGPGVKQLTDSGEYAATGWADFAQSWLQKCEPNQSTSTKEKELTHE